jgi:hypothetical protein
MEITWRWGFGELLSYAGKMERYWPEMADGIWRVTLLALEPFCFTIDFTSQKACL